MTQRNNSRKPNEHAGPIGRVNGHGLASTERGGVPANRGHAASDDASGVSVASAAASPAAAGLQPQASTGRNAYAEVAPPPPNGAAKQVSPGNISSPDESNKKDKPKRQVPPGKYPFPDSPAEFVEEIHRKVDITEIWRDLLQSDDEKIKQRAVERLTSMLYEDGALSGDDPQQIIFDLPRPKRD
jgi:hypothetical protein